MNWRSAPLMLVLVFLVASVSQSQSDLPEARNEIEAQNRRTMERWSREVWGKGRLDLVPELVAPKYIRHDEKGDRIVTPGEYAKEIEPNIKRGIKFTVHARTIDGDLVWSRWSFHLELPGGIEYAGKGIQAHRLENGKIAETWVIGTRGEAWPDE